MGRIFADRAEGTSPGPHDQCSGNPSAFDHATDSSYNEIIDRLVSRGFSDASTGEAAFLLKRVTESHLEPYLSMIETPSSGVVPSIRAANDLMTFDRRYQSILFKYIGIIEAQMRAQYSHWMGHFHGDFSIYDTSLFLRIENHVRTILHLRDEMGRKIRRSRWMRSIRVKRGAPSRRPGRRVCDARNARPAVLQHGGQRRYRSGVKLVRMQQGRAIKLDENHNRCQEYMCAL